MNAATGNFFAPAGKSALRILVVDDDRNTRDILLEALALFGARVRCAASVSEARAILAEWEADVLVSDLGMPEEDGYDLIRGLRNDAARSHSRLPAIALTGYTREAEQQLALASGFDEVIAKPAELGALMDAIRRLGCAGRSLR